MTTTTTDDLDEISLFGDNGRKGGRDHVFRTTAAGMTTLWYSFSVTIMYYLVVADDDEKKDDDEVVSADDNNNNNNNNNSTMIILIE